MPAALEAAAAAVRDAGVAYFADAATRKAAARDFGGMSEGRCLLLAEPSTTEECARLLLTLGERHLGCTLRGAGYSQSGQSVAMDTVSLGTRRLDRIGNIDLSAHSVDIGAGATMRRVLASLGDSGFAPPTLPLNLDMTVGGLLSAGGVGPASHRHGLVAANVTRLEVVTGNGDVRVCTRDENRQLFNSVLAGVGQGGLITEATLSLCRMPASMRVFSFLYSSAEEWLQDQLLASDAETEFQIEGHCWAAAKGSRSTSCGPAPFTHWMYGLHLAVDGALAQSSGVTSLLASLRAFRKLDEHEIDSGTYLHRYEPRFAGMVQTGAWNEPHPWFEAMVPADCAHEVLLRVLSLLPTEVGDGHRFMWLSTKRAPDFFVAPPGSRCGLIGVLPVALARSALPKVQECVEHLNALVLEAQGRRYLSGWLGADPPAYLRSHFGNRYEDWIAAQRAYDSRGTFRSSLLPEGNRSRA